MVNQATIKLIDTFTSKIPLVRICQYLNISRSTYYYHKTHAAHFNLSQIEQEIQQLCIKTKFLYGYRKIHALINKHLKCSVSKVQRIMAKYNWGCRIKRKRSHRPGNPFKQFDNIINRDWNISLPNRKLTTDITYIPCGNKMLYLSTIMDSFNSEIIAHKISNHPNTQLALDTLNQLGYLSGAIIHSDQGSTYTLREFFELARKKGAIRSMSRKGTPADNAIIESFHSSLKTEMIYTQAKPKGLADTIRCVNNYIKFWNNTRILTKLGNQSPVEYRKSVAQLNN
ncbi:IS3 family transposase [Apilactobacillus apisilvae]|uniref:IS3 family transposase n=1 Tax=Apilactobacillus apisilvae TaxID=2923364 RepID=A0ABY4PIC4_9LACO|nr:IS3 family transposase [Apilactobacillus apisilvae]UQS85601.1 IS3 family transposase [Apilactobacillus apisilvae]